MALSPPSAGLGTPPPMAFQGSQEKKFPQAPGQAQPCTNSSLGLRQHRVSRLLGAAVQPRCSRVPAAQTRNLGPGKFSGRFLLVHAASPWPLFLHLQALWLNHVSCSRGSRGPRTGGNRGRLASSTWLCVQLTPLRDRSVWRCRGH